MISDNLQTSLVQGLVSLIIAMPAAIGAYFAYKASIHSKAADETSKQTEKNTNSMKDALVELTRKSAFAAGILEGRAQVAGIDTPLGETKKNIGTG